MAEQVDRRQFLRRAVVGGGAVALGSSWVGLVARPAFAADGPYGPLLAADANGLRLPAGFSSRVVATSGRKIHRTKVSWHSAPDGGACFPTPSGGWIYVSNSERSSGQGGVRAIEFDASAKIVGARTILSGTSRNCAGGPTPWGTWLSCEETNSGLVWECDPTGSTPGVSRPAMGTFNHEAAAVDPVDEVVYLTEDKSDGGLYRFVPDAYPDLSSGTLQILVDDGGLRWDPVPSPNSTSPATRHQVPNTRRFDGGEGAWFHDGVLWFTTKGDGRVWTYTPATNALQIEYDDSTAVENPLTNVDNVTVAEGSGDVFVAEDGGNMEICLLTPNGAVPFLQLTGVSGSEMTGPAFSPDGTRLYFSSQRNPGRTYEVTGPFRGGTPPPPPPPPSGVVLTAAAGKRQGQRHVDLTWSGATGDSVEIRRNGALLLTTDNDGEHRDPLGKGKAETLTYQVVAENGSSDVVSVTA